MAKDEEPLSFEETIRQEFRKLNDNVVARDVKSRVHRLLLLGECLNLFLFHHHKSHWQHHESTDRTMQ